MALSVDSMFKPGLIPFYIAGAIALIAGVTQARADIITINSNPPNVTASFTGKISEPLVPGTSVAADPFPPFNSPATLTPQYSVTLTSVGAANIAVGGGLGIPALTLTTTITDIKGGQLQVNLDLTQGYTLLAPFLGVAILTTTFNEPSAPGGHGDSVNATISNVGNQALVSAYDTQGFMPTNYSNLVFSGGGSPDIDAFISFNFGQSSLPGDSISLPLTFEQAPEPSTLLVFAAALTGYCAMSWRRRSRRTRMAKSLI